VATEGKGPKKVYANAAKMPRQKRDSDLRKGLKRGGSGGQRESLQALQERAAWAAPGR